MLVTVEDAMCEEMPGVGRCQMWEDAMCGNIPQILCQMCYHDNGQTSALLLNVESSSLAAEKFIISRSQANYTTNRFSEPNTSALIHCIDDGERSTSRPREGSLCLLNMRMGRSQSQSRPFGEKKKSRPSGFRNPDRSRR
jgi:hypothetical protein